MWHECTVRAGKERRAVDSRLIFVVHCIEHADRSFPTAPAHGKQLHADPCSSEYCVLKHPHAYSAQPLSAAAYLKQSKNAM